MLQAKIYLLVRNLAFLILEGPERQTADTRPTSGLPMESLEYDSSYELCGRPVAPKLSAHEPATFFQCVCMEIREEVIFWVKRSVPENCQQANIGAHVLFVSKQYDQNQEGKGKAEEQYCA